MCHDMAVTALLHRTGTRMAFFVALLNRLLISMDLPLICHTDISATATPIVRLTYLEFFDFWVIMTVIILVEKLRMDYSIPSLFFKAAKLSAAFA